MHTELQIECVTESNADRFQRWRQPDRPAADPLFPDRADVIQPHYAIQRLDNPDRGQAWTAETGARLNHRAC